jgi:hypothetical protein
LAAPAAGLDDDAPSSVAGTLASEPPNLPTAVRAAETMTMSSICLLSCLLSNNELLALAVSRFQVLS